MSKLLVRGNSKMEQRQKRRKIKSGADKQPTVKSSAGAKVRSPKARADARPSQTRGRVPTRRVHVAFDHPLLAGFVDRSPANLVQQGTSPNFVVSYDPSLGQAGAVIANYLLTACEYDYGQVQPLFRVVPRGLPFQVSVVYSSGGAWHDEPCTNTSISVGALSSNPPDPTFFRMLVLSEVVEVLEANLGNGWGCAQSHGEALSRVIPDDLIKWKKPINYLSAGCWLNSPRANWVDNTENNDQDYHSIGCGVLFLNWMRFQLNIPWDAIVSAGSATLGQTYAKLTASGPGYANFRALVDTHFPVGIPASLTVDNIFPL
jgi:hypothetical protein